MLAIIKTTHFLYTKLDFSFDEFDMNRIVNEGEIVLVIQNIDLYDHKIMLLHPKFGICFTYEKWIQIINE